MTDEADAIFISRIDCNFPYNDRATCLTLIDEAMALSTNAIFFVVQEICSIPLSDRENVTTESLLDLLAQIKIKFDHPLKEMILDTARKIILRQMVTIDEVISKMDKLREYKDQYAALHILSLSLVDNWERLEDETESITAAWTKNAT